MSSHSGAASLQTSKKIDQKFQRRTLLQQRAKNAPRESRLGWRAVFDSSLDGILIADIARKKFVDCNKKIVKMLGYSGAEILSLSVKDIHPAKELKYALRGFHQLSKGLTSVAVDIPIKRKDGSSFYADISCARMKLSGRKCLIGFFRDVTERKRSEEALIESEEMFRTFTEQSPNMIFINQRGKFVYANPICEKIMGYKYKEFYAPRFNFLSLIHPDDIPTVRRNFLTHQKGKEVAPYEYKMITKGGKLIYGILTSKLIHYRGALAILGIVTDISDRKRAEEALRESENHFRKSIENSPMAMAIVSTKGVIEFFNQKAIKISGYLPQDIPTMERWWVQAYPDRDYRKEAVADWTERVRRGIAAGGEIKGSEYRVTCKDRTVRTMFISGAYIAGKIVVLFDDITERKKAETLLAQREAHLSAIIENQPGMVWLKDAACRFLAVNQKFAHAAGAKSPKSMIGKTDSDFWPENLAKKYRTDDRKTMKTRKSIMVEEPISDKGVQKWYETFKTPIVNEEGCVIGTSGFARDITERRKMDAALRLAYFSIDHANATIFQIDPQARLLYVNDAACRTLGYSREELLSMTIHDIDPNFSESIWKAHWNELRQKKHMNFEGTHKTKDGRIIPVDVSINFLKFEDGEYNFAFVRDISERKRAEDELKKILSLERATLESTADGILVVDGGTGKVTDFNDRFSQLWNIPKKVLRSREDKKLLKHVVSQLKDPKRFLSKVNKLYQHPRKESFDVLEFKDGKIFERYSHPQFVDGKPVGRVWSFRDVTERKKSEELLRKTAKEWRTTFNAVGDAVWLLGLDGRILQTNKAASRMFGKDTAKILGRHCCEIMHGSKEPPPECPLRRMRKNLHRESWETFFLNRWFRITVDPVLDEEGILIGVVHIVSDITVRKRADEAVLKVTRFNESIISSLPGIFYVFNSQGKFLRVNEKLLKVTQYSLNQVLKMNPLDFFSQEERAKVKNRIREVFKKGESFVEAGLLSKDGKKTLHYLTGIRIVIDGTPLLVGVGIDVTERRKAEEAVVASERRLAGLMANLPGMVYRCANERDWPMSFVSEGCLPLTGYRMKDFVSRRILYNDLIHHDDQERIWNAVQEALARKSYFEFTYRIRTKKNEEKWVWERGRGVWGDAGQLMYLEGFITDITARQRAEDFLKEHRHQLLQVIDTVPHMIFAKDQKGRFLLVNQAVARAYGRKPRDLIGVRRQDIHKVREESEGYLKIDQEILASGKSKVIPGEVFTDVHGLRHILQTIRIPFRMVGAKEDSILGVSVDVTEQKKVEDFRNDIIRTVSHELRTPLSIEKEGISLLIDEMMGPVNTQQKEILETVMRSIDRLARMISSLLDVSSIETGKIKLSQKMTDLEPIIKDVIFEFKKRAGEKGIDLSMKPGGCAVQVLMDPDKITQVLSNLVDNAIKFTPKGGIVRISLAVLKHEVECEVRDTGIGIAPENIVKAFEKFHQFARQDGPGEKGFGLGLSIAKGIVELHGGRIWIESEFGKGTRATFSLPLYQGEKDRGHV